MTDQQTAIVTGASRGIGHAIAKSLAASGKKVVLTYKANADEAQFLADELNSAGYEAIALQLVVEDRNSIKEVVLKTNQHFGSISIVVNNAAISQEKPFLDISEADWDYMMKVNLRGPFSLIQEIIPQMQKNCFGRIINISSIGGQWGGLNQVHYAASKSALINLTRSIAKLYSKDGITSNAIAPGLVATDMSANELSTEAGKAKVASIPSARLGTVEEIGSIVNFLASDASSYITGQTINANGGMYFSSS